MYEYKFIRLGMKGFFVRKPDQDYHAIIEEYSREGWRLVQILTPPIGSYGVATYFELIFEKQI
ncbi:MAG TPA: DUF4177 domain-containing protein [Bacillota bacterium]|jgi:hypothetical protein|nr:DUF4177 domain-containing protein [Bacillota bacterium]